jgi:transposase
MPTRLYHTWHKAAHCPTRRRDKPELGRKRWVVERSFAWLNRFCRLTIRYDRRIDIHHAFTALACSIICMRAIDERF